MELKINSLFFNLNKYNFRFREEYENKINEEGVKKIQSLIRRLNNREDLFYLTQWTLYGKYNFVDNNPNLPYAQFDSIEVFLMLAYLLNFYQDLFDFVEKDGSDILPYLNFCRSYLGSYQIIDI
jgi:hypothetical protein